MSNQAVDDVFGTANVLLNAANTITNTAFTTFDALQNPQQRQSFQMSQSQQPPMYQQQAYAYGASAQYGSGNFQTYGFAQPQANMGPNYYPGFTNPAYGTVAAQAPMTSFGSGSVDRGFGNLGAWSL